MAGKVKESHVRRWTEEEVEKFTEALDDPVNEFAFCLNTPAQKISSNNEIDEHIKKSFDEKLARKEFIEINEKNKFKNKGKVKDCKKLDMSIKRLRNKFKSLKSVW